MPSRDLIAEYGAHLRTCRECNASEQRYCDEALEIIERLYEDNRKPLSSTGTPTRNVSPRAS